MEVRPSLASPGAVIFGFQVVRSDVSLHGLSSETSLKSPLVTGPRPKTPQNLNYQQKGPISNRSHQE